MPVSVALDAAGNPSPALLKKLEAKRHSRRREERNSEPHGQGETFFYDRHRQGVKLEDVLGGIVGDALKPVPPIPKVMRWGDSDGSCVRCITSSCCMARDVVAGEALGLRRQHHRSATASSPKARSLARRR